MQADFQIKILANFIFRTINFIDKNHTTLIITSKNILLKDIQTTIQVPLNKIIQINVCKKIFFAMLEFITINKTYRVKGISKHNANKIAELCHYLKEETSLDEEIRLFESITNETQYVGKKYNDFIFHKIKQSIIYELRPHFVNALENKHRKYKKLFSEFIAQPDVFRQRNNERFIEKEFAEYEDFFDNIETQPLTKAQRLAVIVNEDNNLIVAGAGSGKTSVITTKVLYLLEKGLIKPEETLLLTFNKKASEEITARLKSKNIPLPDIKTFHALGFEMLRQLKDSKNKLSKMATDEILLQNVLKKIIKDNLKHDGFLEIMAQYFQNFFYPPPNEYQFKVEGDYYDYLKTYDIRTLNNEKVKSLQECFIANFLYLNGIKYEYEKAYQYDVSTSEYRQYQPDFYLPEYDLYIEHYGIDRDNNTAPYIDREKYLAQIKWKQEIHEKYNTTLITTFSYEMNERSLFKNLTKNLVRYSVVFLPINKNTIFDKLNKALHVDSFTELVSSFLNHFKSNQFSIKDIEGKLHLETNIARQDHTKNYINQRDAAFLKIFEFIFHDYENLLNEMGEIDFHDMISSAIKYHHIGAIKSPYKYILVDEFQDISQGRARLLKELLSAHEDTKLCCVGDDWQAIYRFSGSDVSIMKNFEEIFGTTKRIDLDMTFRFDNQINDIASDFIMKNPNQLSKTISTIKQSDTPSVLIYYTNNKDYYIDIESILQEINTKISGRATVLLLSRFNKFKTGSNEEIEEFKENIRKYNKQFKNLSIDFSSVHGAKGLGYDYVIVLDMNKNAFPIAKIDDPILNLVLPSPELFAHAEERRLFYVALTRAKEKVYLMTNTNPSIFIEELEKGKYNVMTYGSSSSQKIRCPKCGTGILVKSTSKKSYCCSHWGYCDFVTPVCQKCQNGILLFNKKTNLHECTGCNFKRTSCPKCSDGYLIERESKHGEFLGCSNYPKCTYITSNSKWHQHNQA